MDKKIYVAIDLKSFFASVECVSRGLDPLNTNLVVADLRRTVKTICLAVTPPLKEYKVSSRARLFEVVQRVKVVNAERKRLNRYRNFRGSSFLKSELDKDPSLELDYIIAPPRMAEYMKISSLIYSIYLSFVSQKDIHSYSIDEVFIDATEYLKIYSCTAEEFASMLIRKVYRVTGITATCGIGTNLFLAKVAMDVTAKRIKADKNGIRIASLDEITFRKTLWEHENLLDFWSIGGGTVRRLNKLGLHTMGDIALFSLEHEDRLFKEFGVNAELLIDHAWGVEPCTISDIKSYRPKTNSLSRGQVLSTPYTFFKARNILEEMIDSLVLTITEKNLYLKGVSLYVGYDEVSLDDASYDGRIVTNRYGKRIPYPLNVSEMFDDYTVQISRIKERLLALYNKNVNRKLYIRRITIGFNNLINKDEYASLPKQPSLFEDEDTNVSESEIELQKEVSKMKRKFGKNVLLKGISYEEGSTARERNKTIGGHSA